LAKQVVNQTKMLQRLLKQLRQQTPCLASTQCNKRINSAAIYFNVAKWQHKNLFLCDKCLLHNSRLLLVLNKTAALPPTLLTDISLVTWQPP